MPRFHRLAHLQTIPMVRVGQWVKRGDLIGKCGSTGNSTGAHLHYDIPLVNLSRSNWREYVHRLTHAQVKARYGDPKLFCSNSIPMKGELPLVGYHYLQGVRDKSGVYFHSGEDLNGLNDLGKPVSSPVEGRVIYVGGDNNGASRARGRLKTFLERHLNGGWGYFVVIEEKPGFKP